MELSLEKEYRAINPIDVSLQILFKEQKKIISSSLSPLTLVLTSGNPC